MEGNFIRIRLGKTFDRPAAPKVDGFDFDKVEGMLLGLAIGDSLGITTEGMFPSLRKQLHGEIRDYLPNKYTGKKLGYPSDDTQLAFWTLEQIITDRGFVPDHVAKKFCSNRIFGVGGTVKRFIRNYKSGMPWHLCSPHSAGNGALMRIAPICVPHLRTGGRALWVDTAICAMLTHNDNCSISACVAFVSMLWDLLDMDTVPDPGWWLDTYVQIAKDLDDGSMYSPRGGMFTQYKGPAWKYVKETVSEAYKNNLPVLHAAKIWYSGAYLLETIPTVIYILMRHGHSTEEAIVRAVNDTKDSDTIAAIVGAAVGALHGRSSLPDRWIRKLSGRTGLNDDGKVFDLIEEARRLFWAC